MYHNIPLELRAYTQWVTWRFETVNGRQTKVPYTADGQRKADTTNPQTWGSFDQACATAQQYSMGVGFVFSEQDPFTGIDLDDKVEAPATPAELEVHQKILQTFNSYTERSPSGRGYHIIIRGTFDGTGRDRGKVGVYTKGRYFTFTGDATNQAPIGEYQELLDKLLQQMPAPDTGAALTDHDSVQDDAALHHMALYASNGDKYDRLCCGQWQGEYPSQSEADFALLSILAYYTRDNEQVRRLFRMTALGKRAKAMDSDRYLNTALKKIRSKQPELIDLSALKGAVLEKQPSHVELQQPNGAVPQEDSAGSSVVNHANLETINNVVTHNPGPVPDQNGLALPSGLVGHIAHYIYSSAVRPVKEVALVGALALVAGLCGRSYNVSRTGLNQYLILLAGTGTGKEGASSGIDMLVNSVRATVPMIDQFMGPGAFASGQAMVKVLDEKPCFLSIMGEFGLTLQQLCDPRANSPQIMLKKILLDVYNKSGWHNTLKGSAYSDTDKNTKIVRAPNITILGESTPEAFFSGLDVVHIAEGLVPRFCLMEYTGPRPPRNLDAGQPPHPQLVQAIADLAVTSLTATNNQQCIEVQLSPEAQALTDAYDKEVDKVINASQADVDKQIYNRAHVKALKLAALLAVGCHPHSPVITAEQAQWAIDFVRQDVAVMTERFHKGEIGTGDHRQEGAVRHVISEFLQMDENRRKHYKAPTKTLTGQVIPFSYLRCRLRLLSAFKDDKRGTGRALEEALRDLVNADILQPVSPAQALGEYNTKVALYICGPNW